MDPLELFCFSSVSRSLRTVSREVSKKRIGKKWISFGALMLGAGTIYKLGFMKDAFYVPMQEFMGLSHTQIGVA